MLSLPRTLIVVFFLALSFALGAISTSAQTTLPPTRIDVDEASGIIRIFAEGREAVTIDAAGLHVTGNVEYTGTMTDSGSAVQP